MSEQHVLDHYKQIDFWHRLLTTSPSANMDWCDKLAIQVIVERLRGNDSEFTTHFVQRHLDCYHDPTDPVPTPTIEAVHGRANELAGLYLKAEEEAT